MAVVADVDAGVRAVKNGANVVQLRAPDSTARELAAMARELVAGLDVPLLVSSRVDVALAAGAAGVNLPERDLAVAEARRLLGSSKLIGRSIHSLEAGRAAATEGADYVLFGPVFATSSHPQTGGFGLDALRRLTRELPLPVVAIGGVDAARGKECLAAGAAGYAGIRMFA